MHKCSVDLLYQQCCYESDLLYKKYVNHEYHDDCDGKILDAIFIDPNVSSSHEYDAIVVPNVNEDQDSHEPCFFQDINQTENSKFQDAEMSKD